MTEVIIHPHPLCESVPDLLNDREHVHGWRSTDERIERGKQLREEINMFRREVGQ